MGENEGEGCIMKKLIVFITVIISNYSLSQSVTGTSGLIHIPSARMLEDGQLVLGAAFIPKPYFRRYNKRINPGLNTYITYGILPFVEVMFRYTHELNMPVNTTTRYFPDRMLTIRARLLNEKKYLPALVIGLQDMSAYIINTCKVCSNYAATYIVLSKNLKLNFGNFDFSMGYAEDLFDLRYKDLDGVFGGISFTPNIFDKVSISIEHNSKGFNTGLKLAPIKIFNFMIGVWDLNKPTFSFNYKF